MRERAALPRRVLLLGVAVAAVGGGAALLLDRPSPRPVPDAVVADPVAPRAIPGRVIAADSLNTPAALLSLLDPGSADPAADRAVVTLPVPAPPAPIDTMPVVDEPTPPLPAAPESLRADAAQTEPPPPDSAAVTAAPADLAVADRPAPLEPPVVLRAAWFSYPEEARRRRSEGDVEVRILVDTSGGVAAVELEEGAADTTLNSAALTAARTMRFRPAQRGRIPVAVWFNYRFTFALPS